jgi:hypothetical protein
MSTTEDRTVLLQNDTYLKNSFQELVSDLEEGLPVDLIHLKVIGENLPHDGLIFVGDLLLHLVDEPALLANVGVDGNGVLAFLVPAQLLPALALLQSLGLFHLFNELIGSVGRDWGDGRPTLKAERSLNDLNIWFRAAMRLWEK